MADNANALKQANASGFPFQLRVEHDVRVTENQHHWSILSRECAWFDESGNKGFIDLVLEHKQLSTFRLVVECKRIKAQDSRQLQWVFLIPELKARQDVTRASVFEVEADLALPAELQSGLETQSIVKIWDSVSLYPASYESEFCILHGDDTGRQPLLERLAAQLLESVEGLGDEEIRVRKTEGGKHHRLFIFPMIVTNAKLAICRFNPDSVDLENGTLNPAETEVVEVPFLRFRKSLTTEFPDEVFYNVGSANKARERTVFVANAAALPELLHNWRMEAEQSYAIQRLMR